MADKKTCFIIMPVSTPEIYLNLYNNDKDHFRHVLSELFVPAITQAGYEAIEPIAKGSDLIHAEIIKNLETADLVLCDMSILNPNVFFEFGIRTALNKPVSVVKDHQTKSIPFDTGIINHHEYNSELHAWIVKQEIPKLTNHLKESESRSNGQNNLWRYFGLRQSGKSIDNLDDQSTKIDFMFNKFLDISQQLENITINRDIHRDRLVFKEIPTHEAIRIHNFLKEIFSKYNVSLSKEFATDFNQIIVYASNILPKALQKELDVYAFDSDIVIEVKIKDHGLNMKFGVF